MRTNSSKYFWLGLTPIATYAASNDNTPTTEENCDEEAIAALEAVIAAQQSLIAQTNAQIADHEATTLFREGVIAAMEAMLPSLSGKKYDRMVAKIANWQAKIDKLDGKIMTLEEELAVQTAELAASETELTGLQALCDGVTPGAFGLFYLHSDHLGKTQFATDDAGIVVWDGGIATPFGESVTLASAFAQNLMFPGQYEDEETGLSHNWHRTYDPTLGRYLQSDPIGLAGGINRYAYVGGNPLGAIDPRGLSGWLTIYAKKGEGGFGHSFVSFAPDGKKPDNDCGCETYAFWPGSLVPGAPNRDQKHGLNRDFEFDIKLTKSNEVSSRRIWLNDEQEKKFRKMMRFADKVPYGPMMPFGYQCTEFAGSVWNQFSPNKTYAFFPSRQQKDIDAMPPNIVWRGLP